jgi:desert hedgehog
MTNTSLSTPTYLVAVTGGDVSSDFPQCFSALNTVEVQGRGLIRMDELTIGDLVRDGKNSFSRVYSFGHRDRALFSEYKQLFTDRTVLEVSDDHLLYVGGRPIRASEVKVGDLLGDTTVTRIESVSREGLFAPVTYSGKIEVSGIVASNYVAIFNEHFSTSLQNNGAHMATSIHRLLCRARFQVCSNETYTAEGISSWSAPIVHFLYKLKFASTFVQMAAAVPVISLAFLAYSIETIILTPGVLLALILLIVLKRKTTSSKLKIL